MKKVFLASRFKEFESIRKKIISHYKNSEKIKIENLDPNGVDIRTPTILSIDEVTKCDFLLLLVGDTYGEIPIDCEESITHIEYITAREYGTPWLAFYVGKNDTKFESFFSTEDEHPKLIELKKEIFLSVNNSITSSFNKSLINVAEAICKKVDEFVERKENFLKDKNRQFGFGVKSLPNNSIYLKRSIEINAITTLIISDDNSQIGIVGMGGVGKSVIASDIAFSKEIRNHFENVYSVEINQKPDIRLIIITLLEYIPHYRHLNLENISINNGLNKLRTYFRNKKILLLLDDVWDSSIISELKFINNESKTLITTRKNAVLTNSASYEINYLTDEQASELFYKINPTKIENKLVNKVIQKSGKLPLAITIIASKLKNKPVSFYNHFLKNYKISNINYPVEKQEHRNLFNVIDFTFEDFDSLIKSNFLHLSIFPEGEIMRIETLNTLFHNDWEKLISELLDHHLISIEKDIKDNDVFQLHDLIRDFIIEKAGNKIIEIKINFLTAYNNKYQSDWNSIPFYDTFFFKYFIDFSKEINEIELGKKIANGILFNHNFLHEKIVERIVSFLELNPKSVAEKLLNFNKFKGTVVWCIRTLGIKDKDCVSFSKEYLKETNLNFEIASRIITDFQKSEWVYNFAEKWIQNSSNKNPYITATCVKILGNTNKIAKEFIDLLIKTEEWKEFDFTIVSNCIEQSEDIDIETFFNKYLKTENKQYQIITKSISKLGSENKIVVDYAKNYFKNFPKDYNHNQITAKLITILPDNSELAENFAIQYLNKNFGENFQITNKCLKVYAFKKENDPTYIIPNEIVDSCNLYLNKITDIKEIDELLEDKIINQQILSVIIRVLKYDYQESIEFIDKIFEEEILNKNQHIEIIESCLINMPLNSSILIRFADNIYDNNLFWIQNSKYHKIENKILLIDTQHSVRFSIANEILRTRSKFNQVQHKELLNSALLTKKSDNLQDVFMSILKNWRNEIKPTAYTGSLKNQARRRKYYHKHLITCIENLKKSDEKEKILIEMKTTLEKEPDFFSKTLIETINEHI
jgi:hypothetical protein